MYLQHFFKLLFIFASFFFTIFSNVSEASSISCETAHSVIYDTDQQAYAAAFKCGTEIGTKWMEESRAQALQKDPNSDLFKNATTSEIVTYNPCLRTSGPRLGIGLAYGKQSEGAAGAYGFIVYRDSPACWNILGGQFMTFHKYYSFKRKCEYPFSDVEGECAAFCPPYAPEIDSINARCIADIDTEKPIEQCEFNPVVMATGEKLETEYDLVLGTSFPIEIKRIYRSFRAPEAKVLRGVKINTISPSSFLRAGWVKHTQPEGYNAPNFQVENEQRFLSDGVPYAGNKNWQVQLLHSLVERTYGGNVLVNYKDESENFVRLSNGLFKADHISSSELNEDTQGKRPQDKYWEYKRSDGYIVYFDKQAMLQSVVNPQGFIHTYDWEKRLGDPYQTNKLVISDEFGSSIAITFGIASTMVKAEASNGITLDYSYDDIGNLISVNKSFSSSLDGAKTLNNIIKQYHYEDDSYPYALTGMTDERGIRYATWKYDEVGRVVESTHVNDVDKGLIAYQENITTVTNVLGKQTKYHYQKVAGAKRLMKVEGIATNNCAAANKQYTYYQTGRVKTQTDWEGNVSYFEYNDKGQVTKRIDAYGTPEAYTVETQWHEFLEKPVLIVYPNKKELFEYNDKGLLTKRRTEAL